MIKRVTRHVALPTIVAAIALVVALVAMVLILSHPSYTGRTATVVVASHESNAAGRAQADYAGDGADDQIQIQAAIDALPADGGAVVLLEGQFNIGAPITFTKSNVVIRGQGFNTILKLADGGNNLSVIVVDSSGVLWPNNTQHLLFEDFTLDGNKANQTGISYGIDWNKVGYSTIRNVQVRNFLTAGLYIHKPPPPPPPPDGKYKFPIGGSVGNIVDNSYFTGNQIGYYASYSDAPQIINSMFESNVDYGVRFDNTAQPQVINTYIFRNTGTNGAALYIEDSHDELIQGGMIGDNANYGLYVKTTPVNKYLQHRGRIISSDFTENIGAALFFEYQSDWRLTDILVIHNRHDGIKIKYSDNFFITGAVIKGNSTESAGVYAGISIEDSRETILQTSTVDAMFGPGSFTQTIGIRETGTSDETTIINNRFMNRAVPILVGAHSRLGEVQVETFMDIINEQPAYISSNQDLSTAAPLRFTISNHPDVPRNLTGHFDSHRNITAYTVVIKGTNAKGEYITETMTEADGWIWKTANAFSGVDSITMISRTGSGVEDTMDIGIGSKLGLANSIYNAHNVIKVKKNTAVLPQASYSVDAAFGTVDVSVEKVITGGDDFTLWYKSNLNIID